MGDFEAVDVNFFLGIISELGFDGAVIKGYERTDTNGFAEPATEAVAAACVQEIGEVVDVLLPVDFQGKSIGERCVDFERECLCGGVADGEVAGGCGAPRA